MPKTAVNSGESTSGSRFNPYIPKGINRSLLTPCRQVGLSRKRKTPNSDKSFDNGKTSQPTQAAQAEVKTTPLSSKNVSADVGVKYEHTKALEFEQKESTPLLTSKIFLPEDSNQTTKTDVKLVKTEVRKKSSVSKCLIAEKSDITCSKITSLTNNSESYLLKSDEKKSKEDNINKKKTSQPKGKKKKESSNTEVEECFQQSTEKKSKPSKKNIESQKNKCEDIKNTSNSFILKEASNQKREAKRDPSNNNLQQTLPTVINLKEDSVKHIKKSDENYFKGFDESEISNPVIIDHNYTKPEKKKTKLKRSLSMKKSCSEEFNNKKTSPTDNALIKDCSVYLDHILDVKQNGQKTNHNEIRLLEKEVEEKRKLVEELKQAEIYKKLHDVNKLKELTATWKTGCISALNDLLPQLQAHGDIDMATLLNNLRVPEKLISLSENGDLM